MVFTQYSFSSNVHNNNKTYNELSLLGHSLPFFPMTEVNIVFSINLYHDLGESI